MRKISQEQITAVSALEAKERYSHSLKMIADTEEMYSILDSEGNWVLAELEGRTIFFIWSAEGYAQPFLKQEWKDSSVEKITIDEYDDEISDFLNEKNILISVFSINNQSGFVVTEEEFKRDLNIELEQYE